MQRASEKSGEKTLARSETSSFSFVESEIQSIVNVNRKSLTLERDVKLEMGNFCLSVFLCVFVSFTVFFYFIFILYFSY